MRGHRRSEHRSGGVRGCGNDNRARGRVLLAALPTRTNFIGTAVSSTSTANFEHRCSHLETLTEAVSHCARQSGYAAPEGAKRRWTAAFCLWRPRFHCSAQDAAVFAFPLVERGERSLQAQLFRIPCVHSGNERRHEVFQNFVPKFAANEICHRFLFAWRFCALESFRRNSPARSGREQRRSKQGLR